MKKISVLIADDHKLLRETLGHLIDKDPEFEIVALCSNSQEAVDETLAREPDLVLMDINMGPFSGIEATLKIADQCLRTRIIGMSAHADPLYVKKMLKTGANGYVTKNSPTVEMLDAMKKVHGGENYVCDEIKNILCGQLGQETPADYLRSLTDREIQIVEFIKEGQSSKEIAVTIGVTIKTVEVHRHNILKKLKLKNAAALVNFVFNNAQYMLKSY